MLRDLAALLSIFLLYSGAVSALEICEHSDPFSHPRGSRAHEHASDEPNTDHSHGLPGEIHCSPLARFFLRAAQIAQPCPSEGRAAAVPEVPEGLPGWAADEALRPPFRSGGGPPFHADPPRYVLLSVFRI
jgi:hypothetical protein